MSGIIEAKTSQYLLALLPARDPVMQEMERYARQHGVPIVGPACGRVLYQLARLVKARRVLELGSAIGYSTLWLARAARASTSRRVSASSIAKPSCVSLMDMCEGRLSAANRSRMSR